MSERKVLNKYIPPDFNPAALKRFRKPKDAGPKTQTVRLMAPFSMKCLACKSTSQTPPHLAPSLPNASQSTNPPQKGGEYIYRGRKFNAQKSNTDERYLNIAIFQFFIKCTRCSGQICFKTNPKDMDYTCVSGAIRNFEPWRSESGKVETDEDRLDRLEREEAEMDAMDRLETKIVDAKQEMAIADALDEIRTRNARNERTFKEGGGGVVAGPDEGDEKSAREREIERQEREDEVAARRAFASRGLDRAIELAGVEEELSPAVGEDETEEVLAEQAKGEEKGMGKEKEEKDAVDMPPPPLPPVAFKRGVKRKKDFGAALGIKKKAALV
ncbi:MAG: hypothetical protein LQ340_006199 [Diploschistes diacapsis]|nr:MAG: hypothetical protein LQ340_006199 [Diploschistes diacapsis]